MRDQFRDDGIVLDNALAYWVHRFYEAARREMYRTFSRHGYDLTPEMWAVLVRLWERDGRTQRELADATHRDAPTMSRIVDALGRRGLISRASDPDDARARLIVLTPRGREARRTLVPVVKALVARFEDGISDQDLEVTRRTLRRLAENAD